MNANDIAALAADAESAHDALATLMWWARGVASGADTQRQLEVAERATSIAERAERMANVVAVQLRAMAEAALAGESVPEGGDPE